MNATFSKSHRQLLTVTNLLLSFDTEFTMSRLKVFLLVARASKEGALVRDLVQSTDLNQSTISRILGHLADKPLRGQRHPLQWVRMEQDHEDPRRVRAFPTAQGLKVLRDLDTVFD